MKVGSYFAHPVRDALYSGTSNTHTLTHSSPEFFSAVDMGHQHHLEDTTIYQLINTESSLV